MDEAVVSAVSETPATGLVDEALVTWRDKLINLTARNRLLNFRAVPTSTIRVVSPVSAALLSGLQRDVEFEIEAADTAERADGVPSGRVQPMLVGGDSTVVAKALRNLRTKANQQYLDTGLHILYVAMGALNWVEVDGEARVSPLLLVPVNLLREGPKAPYSLRLAPEDIVVNPALALKLKDFDVTLPGFDEAANGDAYAAFLAQVRKSVARKREWTVADEAHLSYFSFAKEAMYRDLLDNASAIGQNEAVQALACAGTARGPNLRFPDLRDELHPDVIDQNRPPERHPMVLNADVYQRQAIAAAVEGKSFVIEGPPGTGKSQTIANMIAALLHEGRTVLFVSEKAAALEVVHKHLDHVGLSAFVQELHSHKAKRAEVAKSLAHALTHRPHTTTGLSPVERRAAEDERTRLNRYAAAMNTVREPFDESPINVLRRLGALHHVQSAPPVKELADRLTPDTMHELLDTAAELARAWAPSEEGAGYLWFGVTEAGPLNARLTDALGALDKLEQASAVNSGLMDVLDLTAPSDVSRLNTLLAHWNSRPGQPPEQWLTASHLAPVREALDLLNESIAACRQADDAVTQRTGQPWTLLPSQTLIPTQAMNDFLEPSPLPNLDLASLTATQAIDLRDHLAALADLAAQAASASGNAAHLVDLPEPADADGLSRLADAIAAGTGANRPDEGWLSSLGLQRARAARTALLRAHEASTTACSAASDFFTPAVLDLDVQGLRSRFANIHTGFKKMSAAYRVDKATVAAASQPGIKPRAAIAQLSLADTWKQANYALAQAEEAHAAYLGEFYAGRTTDWASLESALMSAHTILTYAQPNDPHVVVSRGLCRDDDTSAAASLPGLQRLARDWIPATATGAYGQPSGLAVARFDSVVRWASRQLPVLDAAIRDTRNLQPVLGEGLTVGEAAQVMDLIARARAAHEQFVASEPRCRDALLDTFGGLDTDTNHVRSLLEWTVTLRAVASPEGGEQPLLAAQVDALNGCVPIDLTPTLSRWEGAVTDLLEAFSAERREALRRDLDHFSDAKALLEDLLNDPAGQTVWFSNQAAIERLNQYGLGGVVAFCVRQSVDADRVPDVVEKAVLTGWIERVLETTPELSPIGAADRDSLVQRYRESDKRLIATAISDIIQATASRRPTVAGDGYRIIEAEGRKKTRHMPVRDLLAKSENVALTVKPCFMMSPLSVSQYLPPNLRFDTVIFDEASQVRPEDAINSIYRGRSLIVVGDEKQMPPTSFWDTVSTGDGDAVWVEGESNTGDFDSVLTLAAGSASFESFMLQMHYRSQHESLITFSNHAFYGGDLHTFPSARETSNRLGVEFIPAHGVYQRGSTKDNPIEAEKVAERVIHHFDTRPGDTLGVVAFSEAQRTAIELALDRVLTDTRPDLRDKIESTDRLQGFFTKNLETVQGDERDVIIFSIGYGPDQFGKTTNNFGPLNLDGGWRRLNVAVTRARRRVEVVASMRAADIADSANESVRHFRRYLDYAERGIAALGLDVADGSGPESPFEESVIATIRGWGYDVVPQVGTAGYRIDIAVRHPDRPDMYVLAVECDGYAYHSSKAARDRDRIRHEVLSGLGWNVHHIWGTAWYRQRDHEEQRLRDVIEAAIASDRTHLAAAGAGFERPRIHVVQDELPDTPPWANPYRLASLTHSRRPGIDLGDQAWRSALATDIQRIVEVEGPVHTSIVDERIKAHWHVQRIGGRIRSNIDSAIRASGVAKAGGFLDVRNRVDPVEVRVRTADPRTSRTIEQVSDAEISMAILEYVADSRGVSQEMLLTSIARLFGWSRTGAIIHDRVDRNVRALLREGRLQGNAQRLVCNTDAA